MQISTETKDTVHIIKVKGRLDATTAHELEEVLTPYGDQPKVRILVDCEGLDYISSAGLRVLLASAKQFKKQESKIGLTALNPNVKQVFEISGFTSIFPIYENTKDAVDRLKL